ncbi:MAG: Tyrosine 3-monooxygenase [Acidimicrobiales bacterium]|nr:Tyrosine 3-monooxygenase [Acidimicrobiales bacterium]
MASPHRTLPDRVVLAEDHPGFADPAYRARRDAIAGVGAEYRPGQPIPDVTYSAEEDDVWRRVSTELAALHRDHACREYLVGADRLVLPTDRVPQLREVDERTAALTGFSIRPVPGLVPTRTFYGALADRTFLATQYIRHHSVPHYTPEPDIVHEIIGHANALASSRFADLYQAAGEASRRATTAEALEVFSRIFWFTLEFGVVVTDATLRAYGAGILSSFGELDVYRGATVVPWDLPAMAAQPYDITRYQPVLYAAPSEAELFDHLGAFFATFDDDVARALSPS